MGLDRHDDGVSELNKLRLPQDFLATPLVQSWLRITVPFLNVLAGFPPVSLGIFCLSHEVLCRRSGIPFAAADLLH
jgi:hypothetical protein